MGNKKFWAATTSLLIAAALIVALSLWLLDPSPGEPAAATALSSQTSNGGGGIRVHGHWTIEVRDADGSVAGLREFDNDLAEDGNIAIREILQRNRTPGIWTVKLSAGEAPLGLRRHPRGSNFDLFGTPCVITEPDSQREAGSAVFFNLNVVPPERRYRPLAFFVLSGSATASKAGNIGSVTTSMGWCGNNVSPDECVHDPFASSNSIDFTATDIEPIDIVPDQEILVTVEISFF